MLARGSLLTSRDGVRWEAMCVYVCARMGSYFAPSIRERRVRARWKGTWPLAGVRCGCDIYVRMRDHARRERACAPLLVGEFLLSSRSVAVRRDASEQFDFFLSRSRTLKYKIHNPYRRKVNGRMRGRGAGPSARDGRAGPVTDTAATARRSVNTDQVRDAQFTRAPGRPPPWPVRPRRPRSRRPSARRSAAPGSCWR